MEPLFLPRDQILSLWNGSTDYKTLGYQRTHPAYAATKLFQSCPSLYDPTDGSLPDSTVPGILQARVLSGLPLPSLRTNLREYQIVRTHTKETLEYKNRHHPTTSSTLFRTSHLNTKQTTAKKLQTQSSADRITTSLSLAHHRKNKQTSKKSAPISSYMKLHKPGEWL